MTSFFFFCSLCRVVHRADRQSHEISRLQEAKDQLHRQCDDFWNTITILSANAAEAQKKVLILECKHMALHLTSENKVNDAATRLNQCMAENQTLTKALVHMNSVLGGVEPAEIIKDFDATKANLASALVKIGDLEGEIISKKNALTVLENKITEMKSMHEVMKWEVELLQTDRKQLTTKLDETEASLSVEYKKRETLEQELAVWQAKAEILTEDSNKVINQKGHLSSHLTKVIRERDELKKRILQ